MPFSFWMEKIAHPERRLCRSRGVQKPVVPAWYEGPFCGVPVMGNVIPDARGTDEGTVCRAWCYVGVGGACHSRSNDGDRSAEHAVAADRFAREIVCFLTDVLWRACGG